MAVTNFSSSTVTVTPLLVYLRKPRKNPPLLSSIFRHSSSLTEKISNLSLSKWGSRGLKIVAQSKDSNSADAPDRLISAICYFYPFFDGIQYGKYVISQVAPIKTLIQPLVPAIKVFKGFPLNGLLVFITLYFVVVRNNNFSRYVRFNIMQAIVLDVLLIFPDLLERSFNPRDGVGLDLLMSFDSTVFLFLLVCLIYGSFHACSVSSLGCQLWLRLQIGKFFDLFKEIQENTL